jgi:prokaryotic ubiquitin-like protein Pup
MVRQQIERKRGHRRDDDEVADRATEARSDGSGSALSDDIDEILDEIDAILEQNAEEFVNSYVQKGGE